MAKQSGSQRVIKHNQKQIIEPINIQDFWLLCEMDDTVKKAYEELIKIAIDKKVNPKTRADIWRWLIEMNVGKPKQSVEAKVQNMTVDDFMDLLDDPSTPYEQREEESDSQVSDTN